MAFIHRCTDSFFGDGGLSRNDKTLDILNEMIYGVGSPLKDILAYIGSGGGANYF